MYRMLGEGGRGRGARMSGGETMTTTLLKVWWGWGGDWHSGEWRTMSSPSPSSSQQSFWTSPTVILSSLSLWMVAIRCADRVSSLKSADSRYGWAATFILPMVLSEQLSYRWLQLVLGFTGVEGGIGSVMRTAGYCTGSRSGMVP